MSLYYADIASYQAGLNLSGVPFVVVKATEGTSYFNPTYAGFKSQAASKGIKFAAYHAFHAGNAAAQADFAFSKVGAGTPLMLDWENFGDNPNLNDAVQFIDRYRARGGSIRMVYLPKWYWQGNIGSPNLKPLVDRGCLLVASNYNGPENAAGWASFGGMPVWALQFSSTYPFNGQQIDMNNYHGTIAQLWADITGTPNGGFLMALTDAEQLELLTIARKMGAADPSYKSTQIVNAATQAATQAGVKADAVGAKVDAVKAELDTVKDLSGPGQVVDPAQLAAALTQVPDFYTKLAAAISLHATVSVGSV